MHIVSLVDKNKEVRALLEIKQLDAHSLMANCYRTDGISRLKVLEIHDNEDLELYQFFADVYMKWDGCTHWWLKGEDFDISDDKHEVEAYYHLCGTETFIEFIRTMCFVWKASSELMASRKTEYIKPDLIRENYFDNEKIKELVDSLLDGYTIEY